MLESLFKEGFQRLLFVKGRRSLFPFYSVDRNDSCSYFTSGGNTDVDCMKQFLVYILSPNTSLLIHPQVTRSVTCRDGHDLLRFLLFDLPSCSLDLDVHILV